MLHHFTLRSVGNTSMHTFFGFTILFLLPTCVALNDLMARKATKRKTVNNDDSQEPKTKKRAAKSSSATYTGGETTTCTMASSFIDLISDKGWKGALSKEMQQDYFRNLESEVKEEYTKGQVFPPQDKIFTALNLTGLNDIKVVLMGQDPYHDDGQAMGLSFSVPSGLKVPPSLSNMYKELETDIPCFKTPGHGNLEKWAKQGVFLLNATLTVKAHQANSHSKIGWQTFTDTAIKVISDTQPFVVFMLWGKFAHKKEKLINTSKHAVLKDAHPSPLSFGKFKGCQCFSRVNQKLKEKGRQEIDWTL